MVCSTLTILLKISQTRQLWTHFFIVFNTSSAYRAALALSCFFPCRCRNPNEVLQDGIIIGRNSQPEDARFKFRVFQFVALTQAGAPQQLFVHAMVHLCDQKVEIQCSIVRNANCCRFLFLQTHYVFKLILKKR